MKDAHVRIALLCGAVGGPLFALTAAVAGATRADYDPLRHPISSLALGEHGWTQTANFIVCGILYTVYAAGLRPALKPGRGRLWAPVLLAGWGLGMIGSGLFITDPVSGYPPGTPDAVTDPTTTGTLHDLFALPVFLGFPVLCTIMTARFITERRIAWTVYTAVTATSFLIAFFASGAAFAQQPGLVEFGGLLQRLTVAIALTWLTLLALSTRRRSLRHQAHL
ncbi:DUF998 domain-containing protein [Phytomonospora endophytica]|uniref:DUF998 domain-containing protein n=1 Tax=Phytomonospora endophytica TaxID=714109 RepID=A0A841FKS0_9ACTN|nr:DUF998 domain-containing protein [Phytomonospora endophytica]MBB6033777.1 hypothetical protein [Phytomonospora endophytica]GIG64705.1 hypothetical protein Pen01_10000 [Phytomonospora endophytica]